MFRVENQNELNTRRKECTKTSNVCCSLIGPLHDKRRNLACHNNTLQESNYARTIKFDTRNAYNEYNTMIMIASVNDQLFYDVTGHAIKASEGSS